MSWGIFKSNMKRYMLNQRGVSNLQAFAKKLTTEYDMCMKRGIQGINLCTIQKGNSSIMEVLVIVALTKCVAIRKGPVPPPTSPIIKELGNAVKAYWAGATMNPFPIPPIPAPGAIQNLVVTQNLCINPGTWPVPIELPAVNTPNFFLDIFVLAAQIHLLTLKGIIYTTSLYPSAPSPIPGPGVISWSIYVVPGGGLGLGNDDDGDTLPNSDWQFLGNEIPPMKTIKRFRSNEPYFAGDVIESGGNYYVAQNPEKNGQRCWNIPF